MADKSDHGTVLGDSVLLDFGEVGGGLEFLLVLGEGLSLGVVPVLVESSLEGVSHGGAPESGQRPESLEGLDVSDHSDDSHGGSLEDGDCLDLFLLVEQRSDSLVLSDHVSHSGLDSGEGCQVRSEGLVVLGEGLYLTSVMSGSSLGSEPEISLSWLLKLSVRHLYKIGFIILSLVFDWNLFQGRKALDIM